MKERRCRICRRKFNYSYDSGVVELDLCQCTPFPDGLRIDCKTGDVTFAGDVNLEKNGRPLSRRKDNE